MKNSIKNHPLLSYFLFAFSISWLLWGFSLINEHIKPLSNIFLLLSQFAILGPMLSSFIVSKIKDGKGAIKKQLLSALKIRVKWIPIIVLLPLLLTITSYSIKILIEKDKFTMPTPPMPIYIFVFFLLIAGGPLEEFGWRGFALPNMLKTTPVIQSSLILGLIHGIWHLPLVFISGSVQSQIPFIEFVIVTIFGSILYTYFYIKTKSLASAILFHWFGNLGCLFVYYDTFTGRLIFFILQLIIVLIVIYKCKLGKKKIA